MLPMERNAGAVLWKKMTSTMPAMVMLASREWNRESPVAHQAPALGMSGRILGFRRRIGLFPPHGVISLFYIGPDRGITFLRSETTLEERL